MLILAFDTATDIATSALVDDGELLGERTSLPKTVLADADALLRGARRSPSDLDAIVVGRGPGSFTSTRIGLAAARGLALSLGVPVAGVLTLEVLQAGALAADVENATPIIDARRREVFTTSAEGDVRVLAPEVVELEPGAVCIGSGAVRYRDTLEGRGAEIPPDDDPLHVPRALYHAQLAEDFGPPESVVPIYVRVPDVEVRA